MNIFDLFILWVIDKILLLLLQAPGIEALRNPKDLTPTDAVGVVVKGVAEMILSAARKV